MNKFLIAHLMALAALSRTGLGQDFQFFEPVRPPRPFQVMAHRGQASQAPANTRAALQHCIEDGLEWAQVEVRRSRDGHHVLWHEDELPAGAGLAGRISQLTLNELMKADVGAPFAPRYAGERLLSLADCLQLSRGKLNLCLACKDVNPEQLANEVLQAGMEAQVMVLDKPDHLKLGRAASKGKIAIMGFWQAEDGMESWVKTLRPDAVRIVPDEISRPVVEAFHNRGIKVQALHVGRWDEREFWDQAIAAGVDWIQTDLPEELLAHALWRRLPKRPVRFALHRGACRYAPENTLPAFEKAVRMGADFVEFDVRTSLDGKFYLLHDSTLDGKTDGKGPIANTSSSVIETLSAGVKFGQRYAHLKLPTLDDFLTAMAGKVDLYFDAKAIPPEALAEALERYQVVERTAVFQSAAYLKRLKAINPRIRAMPPLGAPEELDGLAAELKPYAVDARWSILSKELIARCHAQGILVFSDALGAHETIAEYQKAMDWGIDLIQTDHPLRLFRAIELREAKTR